MSALPNTAAAAAGTKTPRRAAEPVTAAVIPCQFKVLQNRSAPAQRSLFSSPTGAA